MKLATIDEDGFLSFPGNFMDNPRFGSSFLVRKSYMDLVQIIDAQLKTGTKGFIILGNPGIGKVNSIVLDVANIFFSRVCFNCISFIALQNLVPRLFGTVSIITIAIFSLERL